MTFLCPHYYLCFIEAQKTPTATAETLKKMNGYTGTWTRQEYEARQIRP